MDQSDVDAVRAQLPPRALTYWNSWLEDGDNGGLTLQDAARSFEQHVADLSYGSEAAASVKKVLGSLGSC